MKMTWRKLLKEYKQATPDQRFAWVQGNFRFFVIDKLPEFISLILIRRYVIREVLYRSHSKAAECVVNGSCKVCGCSMPEKLFADEGCKNNCYKPMKTNWIWTLIRYLLRIDIP